MKYKSIAELYQEQYNKSVDWEIAYPIWDYFQVDYKQLSTFDLLDILHSTRVSNMNTFAYTKGCFLCTKAVFCR